MKDDYTVIIPCFNAEASIERSINSAIFQTKKPDKIIIIDDHSRDASCSIIQGIINDNKCNDITIELFRNKTNFGPSRTRNLGIAKASSTYIAFLDADDYWFPNKMEDQLEAIVTHSLDLIACLAFPAHRNKNEKSKIKFITKEHLLFSNSLITPTVVIKKSVVKNGFDENRRYAEDLEFFLRIFSKKVKAGLLQVQLVKLGKPPYLTNGLSSRLIQMELGELQAIAKNTKGQYLLLILATTYSIMKFGRRIVLKLISRITR